MAKILLSLAIFLVSFSLSAQEFKMDFVRDLKPRNIGTGDMSSRVTAIDMVHTDPDVMFVGTTSGAL